MRKDRWIRLTVEQIKEKGLLEKMLRIRQKGNTKVWPYQAGNTIHWKEI